jgi:hypothetical protein
MNTKRKGRPKGTINRYLEISLGELSELLPSDFIVRLPNKYKDLLTDKRIDGNSIPELDKAAEEEEEESAPVFAVVQSDYQGKGGYE